jgi:hypothetical protein
MDNLLNAPLVSETRRNHALEHATIHLLSARFPKLGMAGHSNPTGFFLIGQLSTEDVRAAVSEALARLQNGESGLAIHPGCGTNYVVTGALGALFALIGMIGTKNARERWERFPLLMALSMLAVVVAPPLGSALQKQVTTDANPGGLTVVEVVPVSKNVHRVVTRS